MAATTDKSVRETHEKLLLGMKDGDSFFIEGVKPQDLGYLRQMGYRLNIRLSIRFTLQDQIYGKMGTRVYRDRADKKE